MKKKLTVYQKPTCTKCRMTLRLLRERGAEFEAINYFERPLSEEDLCSLLKKLGLIGQALDNTAAGKAAPQRILFAGRQEMSDFLFQEYVAVPVGRSFSRDHTWSLFPGA